MTGLSASIDGLRFTLARGEALTEELAQACLDDDICPLDWSSLEEHSDWDGDESGTYLTQSFQCVAFNHCYRYEYVDRESGRPILEDELEEHAADARPFPVQCDHRGDARHPQQFVPWGVARRAYQTYSRLFGNGQTLERLAERAGFGERELAVFLKAPRNFEEMDRLFKETGKP